MAMYNPMGCTGLLDLAQVVAMSKPLKDKHVEGNKSIRVLIANGDIHYLSYPHVGREQENAQLYKELVEAYRAESPYIEEIMGKDLVRLDCVGFIQGPLYNAKSELTSLTVFFHHGKDSKLSIRYKADEVAESAFDDLSDKFWEVVATLEAQDLAPVPSGDNDNS